MTDFRCWRANRSARLWARRKTARVQDDDGIARDSRVAATQVTRETRRIPANELILKRDDRLSSSRVSLAGAATEELAIDPAGLVSLRGNDVQASEFRDAAAQLDVRSATGHVRRDGDLARLSGAGNDLRLLVMAHGVEDLMIQVLGLEQR